MSESQKAIDKGPEFWSSWLPVGIKVIALGAFTWEVFVENTDRPALLALIGSILVGGEVGSYISQRKKELNADQRDDETT